MFPYNGEIEDLSRVLDRNRNHLRNTYQKTLGNELFGQLEQADAEMLDSRSFASFDLLDRVGMPYRRNNKFMASCLFEKEPEFSPDGHFSDCEAYLAPAFIFSHEGFELTRERYRGWISPYLAPYIHEYDHFISYGLQEIPMSLAITIMTNYIRPNVWPPEPQDIVAWVNRQEGTREERQLVAFLGLWGYMIHNFWEACARKLDAQIFKKLVGKVPDHYGKYPPKTFLPFFLDSIQTGIIFPIGDMLYGTSVRERLRKLRDWVDALRPSMPIQANFMESLRRVKIHKITFSEMMRMRIDHTSSVD